MIVILFEYPVSGLPNSVSDGDAAVSVDEQSPDFRHRWGSQQYQRPGQHYRPSTWPSSNTGKVFFYSSFFKILHPKKPYHIVNYLIKGFT